MARQARLVLPVVLVSSLCALALPTTSASQSVDCPCPVDEDFGYRLHHHDERAVPVPEGVGQAALGAIQEVVALLLSDSRTDWSQVSIARLRQHLVDLDEILLHAEVEERPIDRGLVVDIRGNARTLDAVRRVVPAHALQIEGFRGWSASMEDAGEALALTLTVEDPDEVAILRSLGFFGFVSSGVHRPHELLSVARGKASSEP